MPKRPWRRIAAVALLLVSCALAVAACGDDDSGGDSGGIEIKAGRFSWTAADIQLRILEEITSRHPELGVSKITPVPLDPAPAWAGLQRGDLDLLVEANLPNQQAFADEAKGEASLVSETYGGAVQGWFVPRYVVEGDGAPAAGLTSIDQLNEFKNVFDGTLYDADAGWITSQQNAKRIKGFDLDFKQLNSSEAALIAQVKRATDRKEPILFYFYRPHWLFSAYDLVQLEEPVEFDEAAFADDGDGRSAIPTLAAWIAARDDLKDRAPVFYEFLGNVKIPLADIEAALDAVDQEDRDPADVARAWVDQNEEEINGWLP